MQLLGKTVELIALYSAFGSKESSASAKQSKVSFQAGLQPDPSALHHTLEIPAILFIRSTADDEHPHKSDQQRKEQNEIRQRGAGGPRSLSESVVHWPEISTMLAGAELFGFDLYVTTVRETKSLSL